MTTTLPGSAERKEKDDKALMLGLRFAGELGYIIALPAVAFCFAGAYLDKYMHTSPIFFLLSLPLALTLSTVGVIRKIREINKSEF